MTDSKSAPTITSAPAAPGRAGVRGELRGRLGTLDLVFTVVAYNGPMIVMAGFVPVIVAFGNGLGAPLVFLTLGVIVGLFAVSVNSMASRLSHPGGFYTYVTAGLGRPAGLAAGAVAVVSYVALAGGTYALLGSSTNFMLSSVFGFDLDTPWWVWAALVWATVTALTLFNIELSAKVLGFLSVCELLVVLVWNLRVFWDGGPEGRSVDMAGSYFSGSLALALVFGALALTGFEALQVFRPETRDPARTVTRATIVSVCLLVGMYAASTYSYIVAFGPSSAIAAGAADPAGSVLGSISTYVSVVVGDIANVLLITSSFAACLALQSITARYLFAFGRDGVLPARLGSANVRHGSPVAAALAAGTLVLLAFVVPALAGVSPVALFTSETGVGGFALLVLWLGTSVAVVTFFWRRNSLGTTWLQVRLAPLLAAALLMVIVVFAIANFGDVIGRTDLAGTLVGLSFVFVVAAAGAGWALWLRTNRPGAYSRIDNQAVELVDQSAG